MMNARLRVSYRFYRRRGHDCASALALAQVRAARLSTVFAIAKAKGDL